MGILVFIIFITVVLGYIFNTRNQPRPYVSPSKPRSKPQKTLTVWDIKKRNGGAHPWIYNNEIDPDYINSFTDEDVGGIIEEKEMKPY